MAVLQLESRNRISPDLREINKDFDKTERKLRGVNKELKKFKLPKISSGAIKAVVSDIFTAVSRGAVLLATSFTEINKELEDMQVLMTTATGSIEGGTKAMEQMLVMSTKTPFSVDALADSFVKLKTAGLDPMDGTLQVLVDSIAAFGGSSDQLRLVTIAIQQMVGKGVISMEELRRQFGEQVPTAMRAMSAELGMTMLDMVDLISKGGLATGKGLKAVIAGLAKLHSGAALARMNTFTGAVVLLKNQWIMLMKAIGDSQGAWSGVTEAINSISDALKKFRESEQGARIIAEIGDDIATFARGLVSDEKSVIEFIKNVSQLVEDLLTLGVGLGKFIGYLATVVSLFTTLSGSKEISNPFKNFNFKEIGLDQLKTVPDVLAKILLLSAKLEGINFAGWLAGLIDKVPVLGDVSRLITSIYEKATGKKVDFELDATNARNDLAALRKDLEKEFTIKGSVSFEFKNLDTVTSHKVGADPLVEMTKSYLIEMKKMGDIIDKNATRYVELSEIIAAKNVEIFNSTLELNNKLRNITRGGMDDRDAYDDQLAQIEELKEAAKQASFEAEDATTPKDRAEALAEEVTLLQQASRLIDSLPTDGIPNLVSEADVQAAEKLADSLRDISLTSGSTIDDYNKWQEQEGKLADLQQKFAQGERDIVTASDQRKRKYEETEEVGKRLLSLKEAERDAAVKEQEDIVAENTAVRQSVIELGEVVTSLAEAYKGVGTAVVKVGNLSITTADEMVAQVTLMMGQMKGYFADLESAAITTANNINKTFSEIKPLKFDIEMAPSHESTIPTGSTTGGSSNSSETTSPTSSAGASQTTINNNFNASVTKSFVSDVSTQQARSEARA